MNILEDIMPRRTKNQNPQQQEVKCISVGTLKNVIQQHDGIEKGIDEAKSTADLKRVIRRINRNMSSLAEALLAAESR